MHSASLVTVIIPTYNRATKVIAAIESVLKQTYANVQIIVADDGSTDNTASIIKNYSTVEYLQLPHGGQGWARNHGLLLAKGKYIASLDSDDVWHEDFLEKCVEMIERNQLDFVFTNWMQELGNGQLVERFTICDDLRSTLRESSEEWIMLNNQKLREIYLTGCPSPSSSLLIKRSSMQATWDDGNLRITDDWSMLMNMIFNKSCKAAFTRQVLWSKYLDGQNIYDGRNFADLTNDFWVHDKEILFSRVKLLLSKKEIKTFKKDYISHVVNLAYHHLMVCKQFNISFNLLKRAFTMNTSLVFVMSIKKIMNSRIFLKLSFRKPQMDTMEKGVTAPH